MCMMPCSGLLTYPRSILASSSVPRIGSCVTLMSLYDAFYHQPTPPPLPRVNMRRNLKRNQTQERNLSFITKDIQVRPFTAIEGGSWVQNASRRRASDESGRSGVSHINPCYNFSYCGLSIGYSPTTGPWVTICFTFKFCGFFESK